MLMQWRDSYTLLTAKIRVYLSVHCGKRTGYTFLETFLQFEYVCEYTFRVLGASFSAVAWYCGVVVRDGGCFA